MRRRFCVRLILLFLFGFLPACPLSAQQTGQENPSVEQDRGFRLEQNYPNPFNPETRVPFVLGEQLFEDGRPVVVSLRIYDILQQFVAAPMALAHPQGEGVALLDLEYAYPGRYEAYWDGTHRNGNQVASGVYFVQLTVNGQSVARKMYVTK